MMNTIEKGEGDQELRIGINANAIAIAIAIMHLSMEMSITVSLPFLLPFRKQVTSVCKTCASNAELDLFSSQFTWFSRFESGRVELLVINNLGSIDQTWNRKPIRGRSVRIYMYKNQN